MFDALFPAIGVRIDESHSWVAERGLRLGRVGRKLSIDVPSLTGTNGVPW